MKRKFMALALAAAMTVSMTSAVLQQMRSRAQMIWRVRRSVFSLEQPVTQTLQRLKTQQ